MALMDAVVAVAKGGGFRAAARVTASNASRLTFSDSWLDYNDWRLIPVPLQAFLDSIREKNARETPQLYQLNPCGTREKPASRNALSSGDCVTGSPSTVSSVKLADFSRFSITPSAATAT